MAALLKAVITNFLKMHTPLSISRAGGADHDFIHEIYA